jgi:hypothetical protein
MLFWTHPRITLIEGFRSLSGRPQEET